MDERAASLRNGVRFGSTGVRTRGYHDPAASFTSPHGFHICIRHGVPGHWRCSNPGGNFWSVYGRSFRFFGIFFAFCSWVYSIFNVVSRCFSFPFHLITSSWHVLSSTLLLRTYFSSHARLPASGHLRYGFGLEHDILNSF